MFITKSSQQTAGFAFVSAVMDHILAKQRTQTPNNLSHCNFKVHKSLYVLSSYALIEKSKSDHEVKESALTCFRAGQDTNTAFLIRNITFGSSFSISVWNVLHFIFGNLGGKPGKSHHCPSVKAS
jgi:hypothetical protein